MFSYFSFFFFPFTSLRSLGLPSYRNCEHVSTSPSQLPHSDLTSTCSTNASTSSLGLLQLLRERGISASPDPCNKLHYGHSAQPSRSTVNDKGGGLDKKRETNIFSLNLVEKLQGLGLHRVAAWGMMGRSGKERDAVQHPPKVWGVHLSSLIHRSDFGFSHTVPPCSPGPTTAPVSCKLKPQNVLAPHLTSW